VFLLTGSPQFGPATVSGDFAYFPGATAGSGVVFIVNLRSFAGVRAVRPAATRLGAVGSLAVSFVRTSTRSLVLVDSGSLSNQVQIALLGARARAGASWC
jgi:hypothetical protein